MAPKSAIYAVMSDLARNIRVGATSLRRMIAAYTDHPEPLTAATSLTAFVIGANGPFYPFYLFIMIGSTALPVFLTMLASPLFLAIPFLARRHPRVGRMALPVLGTLNTVWCIKLLGMDSGVALFLLPCIGLAGLSFTTAERRLSLSLLALPFAFFLWQTHGPGLGAPLLSFTPAQAAALRGLNIASVGTLTAFIGLVYAREPGPSAGMSG